MPEPNQTRDAALWLMGYERALQLLPRPEPGNYSWAIETARQIKEGISCKRTDVAAMVEVYRELSE